VNHLPEEAARRILAEGSYGMPVDVEQIAQRLNITIRQQELEDNVSGILVIKQDRAVIGVNKDHHPHRQRFTIAHEIGHYLLHREAARVFIDAAPVFFRDERTATGDEPQEIEANTFAAALLMPEQALRDLVRQQPLDVFDDAAVRRFAGHFGVSAQAITIRLTRLSLITA
jgi:Zn-dependent peptidase ImmA (M78 family)